jgi:hypothetical protein
LISGFKSGLSIAQLASALGYTKFRIRSRLKKFKLVD